MRCVAVRCPDDAKRGGQLCAAHQRRFNACGGFPKAGEPVKGDPSGHGRFGFVDLDGLGVLCHDCGARFAWLGQHIRRTHDLSAGDYKKRHGVSPQNAPPRDDGQPRRRSQPCKRCQLPITTDGKLCAECKANWVREQQDRANRPKPVSRTRWRSLTEAKRTELADAGPDALPAIVRRLQLDRVGINVIASELGRDVRARGVAIITQAKARAPKLEYLWDDYLEQRRVAARRGTVTPNTRHWDTSSSPSSVTCHWLP